MLRRVWNFKSNALPTQQQIEEVLPLIGWDKVIWNTICVRLPKKGMELDFGGYVKEYTADVAANLCLAQDVCHGLVNLGGDIRIIGPHPDGSPWRVGVRHPRDPEQALAMIPLNQGGLASSGDYESCMFVDGVRYSHILNPKTGWPVQSMASASVYADHCVVAGTASTIAMLKGEVAGTQWLRDLGLPYICMSQNGTVTGTLAKNVI